MKKKHILLRLSILALIILPGFAYGQYSQEVLTSNQRPYYLVGSLPPVNGGNYSKLQLDIFGGGWTASTLGVTTFYVANRDALVIHQVTNGSGADHFVIKAYANPNGYTDIYITTAGDYAAFSMKSCMLQGNGNSQQLQPIVQQTPVGTDITPVVLPVLITDANGNIALNTYDSKGYKFAVNGSAIATSMTVKLNSGWGDYVFEPDYHLPSLTEVKTYVDQNHHLPEIPSAQEIAKDGLNLGEMNKLLMKKVEELTLYLIEKDQIEKRQEQRIQKLEQQLNTLINKINQ